MLNTAPPLVYSALCVDSPLFFTSGKPWQKQPNATDDLIRQLFSFIGDMACLRITEDLLSSLRKNVQTLPLEQGYNGQKLCDRTILPLTLCAANLRENLKKQFPVVLKAIEDAQSSLETDFKRFSVQVVGNLSKDPKYLTKEETRLLILFRSTTQKYFLDALKERITSLEGILKIQTQGAPGVFNAMYSYFSSGSSSQAKEVDFSKAQFSSSSGKRERVDTSLHEKSTDFKPWIPLNVLTKESLDSFEFEPVPDWDDHALSGAIAPLFNCIVLREHAIVLQSLFNKIRITPYREESGFSEGIDYTTVHFGVHAPFKNYGFTVTTSQKTIDIFNGWSKAAKEFYSSTNKIREEVKKSSQQNQKEKQRLMGTYADQFSTAKTVEELMKDVKISFEMYRKDTDKKWLALNNHPLVAEFTKETNEIDDGKELFLEDEDFEANLPSRDEKEGASSSNPENSLLDPDCKENLSKALENMSVEGEKKKGRKKKGKENSESSSPEAPRSPEIKPQPSVLSKEEVSELLFTENPSSSESLPKNTGNKIAEGLQNFAKKMHKEKEKQTKTN